jgi:ketosteroid isomerase-like protein
MNQDHPILSCEADLVKAQLAGDVSQLERLLDDDLYFVGLGGVIFSKADDLAAHRMGEIKITKMVARDRHITPLDSVVVVTALMDTAATIGGASYVATLRYTRVWCERADGWKVVAGHMSPVHA